MEPKRGSVHIFGGGTFIDVAPHFSLAARGSGRTAEDLLHYLWNRSELLSAYPPAAEITIHLTRQGDPASKLVSPADVSARLDEVLADSATKMIFMSCAMVDFDGAIVSKDETAKSKSRLRTDNGPLVMQLTPTEKVIRKIRRTRKDIFLVGFKQTFGCTRDEQYLEGLRLLKTASCNLVLANDQRTRLNMVITPEQAAYHETTDRHEALAGLVDMAIKRHLNGTFTRSTVVPGEAVPWNSPDVPPSLRTVVNHCIAQGAYKPFLGATVGHFAVKVGEDRFLTSRRKSDFNQLDRVGLVLVEAKGDNDVTAFGAKPSVGGQSQRIIFREHPDLDCIVHFHCPLRPDAQIKRAEQRPFECGSHQCGQNTSRNLMHYGDGIWAVMLDQHGPNIVFNRHIDPQKVINFIQANWDLSGRTDQMSMPIPTRFKDAPYAAAL